MEDMERYGDYNEIDEPPGGKKSIIFTVIKILVVLAIVAVVGVLGFLSFVLGFAS